MSILIIDYALFSRNNNVCIKEAARVSPLEFILISQQASTHVMWTSDYLLEYTEAPLFEILELLLYWKYNQALIEVDIPSSDLMMQAP